jgi:DNA-binding NtrC family response regulator
LDRAPLTDVILTDPARGTGAVRFRAYRIAVIEGPDRGHSVRLERGSMVVGSAPEADLRLNDGAVSRAHVRLAPFPDGVEVTDLGSKNGTFTAGARLSAARLQPGGAITLGRSTLRFEPEDAPGTLEPSTRTSFFGLVGVSRPMRELFAVLELVAPRGMPILIEGEAGTGKQRTARAIHQASPEPWGPLQRVDATGIDTAAALSRVLPTASEGASLVLAHVDALGPAAQRALLVEIEERRVGVRLMATTQRDLERESAAGRFERGLWLRLGVARVRVPPLRERGPDLPELIRSVLSELGRPSFELGPEQLGRLEGYAWPENVRELSATIERAVSTATDAEALDPEPYKQARARILEDFEREYVRTLLVRNEFNVSKAARVAGIDRVYLHRLLKKYGI